jgi:hypothetical protein
MSFDIACAALEAAKIDEASARERRIDAENAVLAFMAERDEGSVTLRGQGWKATAVYGMNRTIDDAALTVVRDAVSPELFHQVIAWKPALKMEGLRYLRNNEPEVYAQFAQAITARPAKPSVRIEMLEVAREAA